MHQDVHSVHRLVRGHQDADLVGTFLRRDRLLSNLFGFIRRVPFADEMVFIGTGISVEDNLFWRLQSRPRQYSSG